MTRAEARQAAQRTLSSLKIHYEGQIAVTYPFPTVTFVSGAIAKSSAPGGVGEAWRLEAVPSVKPAAGRTLAPAAVCVYVWKISSDTEIPDTTYEENC